jgi:antitoxin (DNA-binding transcriptional repressor) of toxin-antitoxin stability system
MTIGIFEAKQNLSALVERPSQGEEIVFISRGKERARLVGAAVKSRRSVKEIFDSFSCVGLKLLIGMAVKDLIEEEGRF